MKLYYDFHIHSVLSPCGSDDMTPYNIVNMAKLKGLDVIAVTDHNSIENCIQCMEIAESLDMICIPGMEIQTSEEIHVLCLFENIEDARAFSDIVKQNTSKEKNIPEVFGNQWIMDKKDQIIKEDKTLLIDSTKLTIDEVFEWVNACKGAFIPAHIDKKRNSIISNLGFIPEKFLNNHLEFSKNCNLDDFILKNKYLESARKLFNSDAHYLRDISEAIHSIEVKEKNSKAILEFLR